MRSFRHRAPPRRTSAALLISFVAALTVACGDAPSAPRAPSSAPHAAPTSSDAPQDAPAPPAPQPSVGPTVVSLLTYDGSGEVVHPDGMTTPLGWGAVTGHVVATPYPGGSARFEDPSYYDVLGPATWLPPTDSVNPLAKGGLAAHLSDPDMVYDPASNMLRVYYREVTDMNTIWLISSADGTHWGAPVKVLQVPNHLAISPAVVRRGAGDWLMWTVNGGTEGCSAAATRVEVRHSADGVTWSPPTPVQIGTDDETPWHIDVEWIASRHEYWAVYNGKASGSCMTKVLRFATSPDGQVWTVFPSPLLRAGAIPEFADVVYRSSIEYDESHDRVTVLYSGARKGANAYVWQVATEQLDLRTFMARTTAPATAAPTRDVIASASTLPDLTNETAP